MKYKGYEALIEFEEEDRIFVGRVINSDDIIAFDGKTVEELETSFQVAIEQYLEGCKKIGILPNKPSTVAISA